MVTRRVKPAVLAIRRWGRIVLQSRLYQSLGYNLYYLYNFYYITAGSANGRQAGSEPVNLGSIPSPATKRYEEAQRHHFVSIHPYFL